MVNTPSPISNTPIRSSFRSWERRQPWRIEERPDLRVDLRRLDARRDLVDVVRRLDRELLLRRRLEVVGDFFLATRETPIGAIIAQRPLCHVLKMPSDPPDGDGDYK